MVDVNFISYYGQGYPEKISRVLNCENYALVMALHRTGNQLAVGCNDGCISIWDTLSNTVISVINVHVHPISSIAWSHSCEYIISGSSDCTAAIIDVREFRVLQTYHFSYPVMCVQFNPRNDKLILLCVHREFPKLLNVETGYKTDLFDEDLQIITRSPSAAFDRKGEYIVMENTKGKVSVFKVANLERIRMFQIKNTNCLCTSALGIVFSRHGRNEFLINCYDKTIRLYRCEDVYYSKGAVEPVTCFQDLVTRSVWRLCCFTNDGEYVVAGPNAVHSIYIWERSTGGLIQILHGYKGEALGDIVCHPIKPIYYSMCGGRITVWENVTHESWSAYAPNFIDLEQNIVYQEREDEFDITDEDNSALQSQCLKQMPTKTITSDFVDILTIEKPAYYSSDEEGNDLFSYITSKVFEDIIWDTEESFEATE